MRRASGTSFSVEDVRTSLGARAAEIRAVSVRYDYSMKLPPDTEWEDVELLVRDVCRLVFDDLAFETRTGRMSAEEFDREYMHRVWSEIAEIKGWQYQRSERL